MTAPAVPKETAARVIYDMEDGVRGYVRWAEAIRTYGLGTEPVPPGALYAIGCAMVTDAESVVEDWERCFDLTRQDREGRSCA